MKLSTIFKAVTVVSTIATVGLFAYSKVREAKKIKMDNDIEDVVEPKESEDIKFAEEETIAKKVKKTMGTITPKQWAISLGVGCICALIALPVSTVASYCYVVCALVRKAIDNGNLTIEELIDLAYNAKPEVA